MDKIVQLAAAGLGSLGFSLLFNIRGKKLVFATLGGFLAWGVYLLAARLEDNPYLCGFLSTVALTLYAECMARIQKSPVTVFLVAAAIPLIPGAGLYRTMNCLTMRDWAGMTREASYTLLFAASMAAGITLTTLLCRSAMGLAARLRR